jgi:type VI secretion system secreted protein VgrG
MIRTNSKISVAGREIADHWTRLQIQQALGEPTLISVEFTTGRPPKDVGQHFSDTLAQPFSVELQRNGVVGRFEGLVARASVCETGYELTGFGPLHQLTQGPRSRSFVDQSPRQVLEAVLKAAEVPARIDASRALAAGKVPYLAQASETDLAFVSRVAARAGLVVYEHDDQVVIADTANGPSLDVAAEDIEALRVVLEPAAAAGTAATTTYLPHAALTGSTTDATGSGPHARTVADSLGKLFPGPPANIANFDASSGNALTDQLRAWARQAGARSLRYEFSSHRPDISIGSILRVSGHDMVSETLVVTRLTIDYTYPVGDRGHTSTIVAIPRDNFAFRVPSAPQLGAVPAMVAANDDPDKLGRVQVKFAWDDKPGAWARVAAFAAGPHHGALWVPQVDDEVLVEFEYSDPSRPVIVGSLYHGAALPSIEGGVGDVLLARTDAGTEIRIKQTENREEIRLRVHSDGPVVHIVAGDPAKVSITIEQGTCEVTAKTVQLTAQEQFEIKAGKLSLEASDGVTISSQGDVTLKGARIKLN